MSEQTPRQANVEQTTTTAAAPVAPSEPPAAAAQPAVAAEPSQAPVAKPPVDLDDPKTLTDEDFINYYQFRRFAPGVSNPTKHLQEADQKLMNGQFWEAHKMVRESLENAMFDSKWLIGTDSNPVTPETIKNADQFVRTCAKRFLELEVERARRIRRGEKDGVLPRETFSREEAIRDDEKMKPGSRSETNLMFQMTFATRYLLNGQYKKAVDHYALIVTTVMSNAARGCGGVAETLCLTLSFHIIALSIRNQVRQFQWIQHIIDNESPDVLNESDPVLRKIMVDRGMVEYFFSPASTYARHIRKYLLRFIDAKDRPRAIALCKRYLTLQRCYDREDWADLPVKIQKTEQLLKQLEYGSLEDLTNVEQALRVSVSLEANPGTASPRPQTPVSAFNYAEFIQENMPGEELPETFNPKGTIANFCNADGIEPQFVECKLCNDYCMTVPKIVPSAGFIAGMAISGILAPFVIGLVPFAILSVKQPLHYVQHYCSQCSAPIEL